MEKAGASPLPDHSQVVVFPPLIPLAGFLAGLALEWFMPLGARITVPTLYVVRGLGGVVSLGGVAGFAWMIVTMKRARTPIHNARTPATLVETGPFRRSRNPMYLFGSIGYAGLALLLVKPWALALLPIVFAVTHYGVVRREEEFLDRHFGDAYRRYKSRVPRWW